MKILRLLPIVFVSLASTLSAQDTAAAQLEAIRLYPTLGNAGSALNQAFGVAVAKAKAENDPILQQSNWPTILAAAEAQKLGIQEARQKPIPTPKPTPWVPQNTTLGGPAGVAMSAEANRQKYGIIGSVFQKTKEGVLVKLTSSGGYKHPTGAIVFLRGHPDFRKLVEGSRVKCTGLEADPYDYTTVIGAAKTVQGFIFNAPLH